MFTWHRGDFCAGVSSLWFPLMALHLFTWYVPPQNIMPARVTPAWVHPGCCTGVRILLQYEISQRYHVNAKRPHVSVWNQSAGRLERVAHVRNVCDFESHVFYLHEVYLQITRYEMTQSSRKHGMKSKSHPGMKLTSVPVFCSKHPLNTVHSRLYKKLKDMIHIESNNKEVYFQGAWGTK